MLTVTLLLYGAVLIALTLSERTLRQWPLNASVIYLVIGWCAGAALGAAVHLGHLRKARRQVQHDKDQAPSTNQSRKNTQDRRSTKGQQDR